ncbi:tetratricopeptide repeat protein [Pseudolysinimonas yzui]|uniref:Tetratricopeptide repeat protein n=1 Tax=Pseudolysinimonas yzui TaxID=2708254 RepID=A0A8J3M1R3_9MICO|nr:tetratricopeptide repeat protein [Pseudolysinimonas yzui]GHF18303.1 hypothetical protein GCM10011600_19050 [Pseudolysinimonas yzui]
MTDAPRLEGGPGWYIDRESLLPVIEDESVFRAAHAEDPAIEVLVALWSGRPTDAEVQIRTWLDHADSPRLRALLADAWRDQGRTDEAIAAYESLIGEVSDMKSEAVMQQHLGKALFVAGRHEEAAQAFEKALGMRLRFGAEDSLVESSRAAAVRAREAASAKH